MLTLLLLLSTQAPVDTLPGEQLFRMALTTAHRFAASEVPTIRDAPHIKVVTDQMARQAVRAGLTTDSTTNWSRLAQTLATKGVPSGDPRCAPEQHCPVFQVYSLRRLPDGQSWNAAVFVDYCPDRKPGSPPLTTARGRMAACNGRLVEFVIRERAGAMTVENIRWTGAV